MASIWNETHKFVENYSMVKEEWKIYSQKTGWCKKLLLVSGREERNIIFLYPNRDYFTGILVFGEKAVEAAKKINLPEALLNNIVNAKEYREGRSFPIEIREPEDLVTLKKLINIKINKQ